MDPNKHLFDALFTTRFATKIQALKDLKAVAEKHPEDIVPYLPDLIRELESGPEKLKWGVMMLISMCAHLAREIIFEHMGLFAAIADGPSVIARDAYVRMLAMLSQEAEYTATTTTLLLDEVWKSPVNQLPSYAETATKHIPAESHPLLAEIIIARLPDVADYPPKQKKLQQYLKRLRKG